MKIYVKTDGPVPKGNAGFITAGKVYEAVHYIEDVYVIQKAIPPTELYITVGCSPCSHLNGMGFWTLCDQHGNPIAETDWKALAGELAEALGVLMEAQINEAWRYPTVWEPIVRKVLKALARYEQEKGV
jgi:hypothetical protein